MRRPHSAAPPQHGHRLSRPQSGAPVRPVSAATSRQRGFYSEYLPSDVELQPKTSPSGHRGSHSKARLGVARQKLTAARLFDSKLAEEMLGAAILASDPAQSSGDATAERPPMRAYEPKVNAPFKGLAGKAPRPILIERRKRLFALQSIEKLLREEHGIDTTLPETEGESTRTAVARTLSMPTRIAVVGALSMRSRQYTAGAHAHRAGGTGLLPFCTASGVHARGRAGTLAP